jgi:CRP-like cAMP-binding protein
VPSGLKNAGFDPGAVLARIGSAAAKRYRKREVVFSQGEPADAVFYLETGRVKLTVVSATGREAVIAILEPGAFFGEGCLVGQPSRMSTASALTAASIVRIVKKTMTARLRGEPRFAEIFTSYLLSRNLRIEEDLVDHLFNSSEKRLARLLLLLAHFGKDRERELTISRISQETLASMVGTTRSRTSHFLNRFRKMGFIDYDGDGLRVHPSLMTIVLRD